MKKQVLFIAMVLCMVLAVLVTPVSILSVNAKTISTDCGIQFDDETGAVTGYVQDDSKLIIPAAIEGVDVVKIADAAFTDSKNLAEIEIPASVSIIADNAFADNTSITIYGEKDSTAETFAENNDIKFVSEKLVFSEESAQPTDETITDDTNNNNEGAIQLGIIEYIVIALAGFFLIRAVVTTFRTRR